MLKTIYNFLQESGYYILCGVSVSTFWDKDEPLSVALFILFFILHLHRNIQVETLQNDMKQLLRKMYTADEIDIAFRWYKQQPDYKRSYLNAEHIMDILQKWENRPERMYEECENSLSLPPE